MTTTTTTTTIARVIAALRHETKGAGLSTGMFAAILDVSIPEAQGFVTNLAKLGLVRIEGGRMYGANLAKGANEVAIQQAVRFAITARRPLDVTPGVPMRKEGRR